VSFTSALPTPQIILKSAPAPPPPLPTDAAVGLDSLISLTASSASFDEAKGYEAFTAELPQLDSATAVDLLADAGPVVRNYLLRMTCKGMVILPEDQNHLVCAWRGELDSLSGFEERLRRVEPEMADELSERVGELKVIVDQMPLVKRGDYVSAEHFNLHARALRKLTEIEEWMASKLVYTYPEVVQLLDALRSLSWRVEERRAGDVVASADWNAVREALSIISLLDELIEERIIPTVYLFEPEDWPAAKDYVIDGSLIFIDEYNNTVPSSEVEALVRDRPVAFAVEVHVRAFFGDPAPALYPVFYTIINPPACAQGRNRVTDPCFKQFLGSEVPHAGEANVSLAYKASGAKNWTGDSCGWGYKKYEKGAIMEVPVGGLYQSTYWLGRFVDAISHCLLGLKRPVRVVYLKGYTSFIGIPPPCSSNYACWKALCEERGWKFVNLTRWQV